MRKSVVVLLLCLTVACNSTGTLPTLTPWPTYTPLPTYTPFPVPATPLLPEPASATPTADATAIIRAFMASNYRVISVTLNPSVDEASPL